MVVLGLTGFVLFAVSAAVLAVPQTTNLLDSIIKAAWQSRSTEQKADIQDRFNCCGYDHNTTLLIIPDGGSCPMGHPLCNTTVLNEVSSYKLYL